VSKVSELLVAVAMLFGATAVWAGVPAGKEDLKIDLMHGKKGAVSFPHKKHAEEFKKADGSAITCKDCHHTAKSDDDIEACGSCHVLPGNAQKEVDGKKAPFLGTKKGDKFDQKSVIFHTACLKGCHDAVKKKTGKKITSCKTCHN